MRPKIGITTSSLDRGPEGTIQPSVATHRSYALRVHEAGGLPLLLPNLPSADDVEEILDQLDGLLLSGGGDIDPCYWGEPAHEKLGGVDEGRDRFEIALAQAALRRDFPILGICRGIQVLTVATGGDLWQDVPSQIPGAFAHRQEADRHIPSHIVEVTANSRLASILRADMPSYPDNFQLHVNSFHHQAPRNCGRVLSIIATSPDGLVEALAAPDATFVLGVQWHPEDMARTDPAQARLFTALVEAGAGRSSARV